MVQEGGRGLCQGNQSLGPDPIHCHVTLNYSLSHLDLRPLFYKMRLVLLIPNLSGEPHSSRVPHCHRAPP